MDPEDLDCMLGGLRPSDIKTVPGMTVCQYHFLDDLSFVRRPQDVFDLPASDLDEYVEAVKRRFKEAGWEGDGTIGIIWLPPFVGVGIEDTWGSYLWHVKQSNNGTSWVAGDSDLLKLDPLRQQNEKWLGATHELAGLMFMSSVILVRRSRRIVAELTRQVKELKTLSSAIVPEIIEKLFVVAQGDLIMALNGYMDDCYLEVLQEVFEHGNASSLPLGKFKANLNPMRYIPGANEGVEADEEAGQWFTTKGLLSDIWHSYMFEPFDSKRTLLFKACEFTVEPAIQRELVKHVQLRNCIQHHQSRVTEDSLKLAGVSKFVVATDDAGLLELQRGSKIVFSLVELADFAEELSKLAEAFDAHTRRRIRRTVWVPRSFIEGEKKS